MNKEKNNQIILLDLNYTLVANSHIKKSPFYCQIEIEQYRYWLIDLILERTVILITARPVKYHRLTLASIFHKTGFQPTAAFFNNLRLYPPAFKKRAVLERIFPRWGNDPQKYLAIESNPQTRAMYANLGIAAIAVGDEQWTTLPTPPTIQ